MNMEVFKPTKDSYLITKGKDRKGTPTTSVGIHEVTHLCRNGQKDLKGKRRDQFNVACYTASEQGFDYVLVKKEVTNSGRYEPVRYSSYSVGVGSGLNAKGKTLISYDPKDSFIVIPEASLPKRYEDLTVYKAIEILPTPEPIVPSKQVSIETEEDYDVLVQMVVDTLKQKNGKFAKKIRKAVLSCAYHVLFEAVKETDA